jgi:hypothetical protein
MGVTVSSWQAMRATRAEVEQTRQRQIAEANERKASMRNSVKPSTASR